MKNIWVVIAFIAFVVLGAICIMKMMADEPLSHEPLVLLGVSLYLGWEVKKARSKKRKKIKRGR